MQPMPDALERRTHSSRWLFTTDPSAEKPTAKFIGTNTCARDTATVQCHGSLPE